MKAIQGRRFVLAIAVWAAALSLPIQIAFEGDAGATGNCADHSANGGQSISGSISIANSGAAISNGGSVTLNTRLRIDSIATAAGWCSPGIENCSPPPCTCTYPDTYQR